MRKFLRGGGFVIRHGIASVVTIVIPCVLWVVVYFVALLWAIIWNEPVGGPLALPFGFLALAVIMSIVVVTTLFPTVALTEWIGKKRGWPILAQIPISIVMMAVLLTLFYGGLLLWEGFGMTHVSWITTCLEHFLFSLIPLGMYWWIAQSGPLLLSGWRWLKRRAKI
ncbi:MAG TPA: hypothetical protein VM511_03290 [Luteolibacter sp.]|nr:hypothetical protein [Luteolibacter sp.]